GGFAIAELGWLRLHAELKAESANRGRGRASTGADQ
ncbi:MAG: hypothetical protein QOJ17_3618, partial [Rhodospirillaceae bacterium]|nr:hypothetical protein [Rhodospirillaceae bacterium]